jgi:uncharacterized protein YecE (DUF72 family)
MGGTIRIGVSGWRYGGWRGVFYPDDLPQRRELEYASRAFPVLEINGTFYSLQRPEHYEQWYRETPASFLFTVKGGRYVTHVRRLRDAAQPLANFFASGMFRLQEKLGPFLWQLPPNFRYGEETAERIDAFLALLPRDLEAARAMARRRQPWMSGRTALAIDGNRPLRHALEVRHESFGEPSFIDLLRRHGVALVISDGAGSWPTFEDVTADFVYIRLHGVGDLYAGRYEDKTLDDWARRISAWSEGRTPAGAQTVSERLPARRRARDVYCFFDNDTKAQAPGDARRLMAKLGIEAPDDQGEAVSRASRTRAAKPALPKASRPTS